MLNETFMADLASTYGDPSKFSELVFGSPLHGGQQRYAKNAKADVDFLLPGNSWGKTEFIIRDALYNAWFKTGPQRPEDFESWVKQPYNQLIASFSYSVAEESFDRLKRYKRNRPEVNALIARMVESPLPLVELTNGAVIDWGSLDGQGRLVEATRYNRIYVDEAGHIPDISYTFDSILYPRTMGVGGQIHLIGTPKPHSDPYLLEIYEKGKTGEDPFYYSQSGSVLENEFWPKEEQERVLRNPRYVTGWRALEVGEDPGELALAVRNVDGVPSVPLLTLIGRQVILGHFVIAGGYFFNRFHIQRLFEWKEEWGKPEHYGDSFHFEPQEGRLYAGAFDIAGNKPRNRKKRGKGSDPTVGFVIDYTERPWRIVRFDYIEGGEADWEDKYNLMAQVYSDYRLPYLIVDVTGNVDSVQEALQNRGVEVEGVHFGGAGNRKFDMLRNLQLVMEMRWGGIRGALRSPLIPKLKYELDHYVIPDDDIQQDCVMALAMVAQEVAQCELPPAYDGEAF